MSSTIKLYEHNQKAYDALLDMLGERDRACVIKPTETTSICKSRILTTSITNDRRYGNDLPRNVFALHHDGIIGACY